MPCTPPPPCHLGNISASLPPPTSLPPFFLRLLFHLHSAGTLATLAPPCLPSALSLSSPAFSPSASFIRVSFSSVYTPPPTPFSSVHVHVCACVIPPAPPPVLGRRAIARSALRAPPLCRLPRALSLCRLPYLFSALLLLPSSVSLQASPALLRRSCARIRTTSVRARSLCPSPLPPSVSGLCTLPLLSSSHVIHVSMCAGAGVCMCVHVCVHVWMYVHVCVCVCVRVCARAYEHGCGCAHACLLELACVLMYVCAPFAHTLILAMSMWLSELRM